ncbi:MAG TPA: adenylate/guanylate cyclase domain-containing protein [Candidatus Koribacter sp.]
MKHFVKFAKAIGVQAMKVIALIPAWEVDAAIAVAVTAIALAVYAFAIGDHHNAALDGVRSVEQRSLDARFQMRGSRVPDPRIVIVGADEKTLQEYGYPIPRAVYPKLIDRLSASGAKVIAFDFAFPTPETNSAVRSLSKLQHDFTGKVPDSVLQEIQDEQTASNNDARFAASLQKADNVILGHLFLEADRASAIDEQAAKEYLDVLNWHPFPQVLKKHSGKDFDLMKAYAAADGASAERVEPNYKLLADAAKSFGHLNALPDGDGTLRRAYTLYRFSDNQFYPSLEIEAVRLFDDVRDDQCLAYVAQNGLESIELGKHSFRTANDGTVLINYAGPYRTFPHYSFSDVAEGRVSSASFKGKLVFIGPTAIAMGDMRNTPYPQSTGTYMGVEIHANVADNILNSNIRGRGFLSRGFREEMIDICIIILFGLGGGMLFAKTPPFRAAIGVLAMLAAFGAAAFLAFSLFGMWLYVVIPAMTVVVDYAAISSYRMIFEEREKRKVRKTFERYVAPGVIRLIEENPEKYFRTGGEMRELTVMFSDIRDFTSISEGLTPDELVHLLNRYLGDMTGIVFRTWGTLDKYIGDAIMAFWGSPIPQADHAYRACECALRMSEHLTELNERLKAEGKKTLKIGIGLNSGPVNVGNMGSDYRFAWTVMGDNVNLASRLEGQTKSYKIQRLISEFTYEEVKEQMTCRQLDVIRVQGKQKPVAIYELLDFARNKDQYEDLLARFNAARDAYVRQAWGEAVSLFEGLLERYPDDGPSIVLLDRCREFRVSPPSLDWDGVYTTKKEAVH